MSEVAPRDWRRHVARREQVPSGPGGIIAPPPLAKHARPDPRRLQTLSKNWERLAGTPVKALPRQLPASSAIACILSPDVAGRYRVVDVRSAWPETTAHVAMLRRIRIGAQGLRRCACRRPP